MASNLRTPARDSPEVAPRPPHPRASLGGTSATALGILLLGALTARPDAETAAAPRSFPTGIGVVLVDAAVSDTRGNPVPGLTVEDFILKEDGIEQRVSSFDDAPRERPGTTEPATSESATASRRPSTNTGAGSTAPRRAFVLVFDDLHVSPARSPLARQTLETFIDTEARQGDLLTLVVPGQRFVWHAEMPGGLARLRSIIATLSGRRVRVSTSMSDHEAYRIDSTGDPMLEELVRHRMQTQGLLGFDDALSTGGTGDRGLEDIQRDRAQHVSSEARRVVEATRSRRRRLLGSLTPMLLGLDAVVGSKSVILVSEGFAYDSSDPVVTEFVSASRRVNAPITFLDVRGHFDEASSDNMGRENLSDRPMSTLRDDSAGTEIIARETGGHSLQAGGGLAGDLARVARESSAYYLLGFTSSNTRRDGTFRKLEVTVRRPDIRVRVRSGYDAPSDTAAGGDGEKKALRSALELARNRPQPSAEIPLRLVDFAFEPVKDRKVRVVLVADIRASGMRFEDDGDDFVTTTLDVMLALGHAVQGRGVESSWIEWKLRLPARAKGANVWVPFERSFDLPPGPCQARLIVRERSSGRVGSVTRGFEVPGADGWRVSSPILTTLVPESPTERPRPAAGRVFAAGSVLHAYVEIYGAPPPPPTGSPRVTLRHFVESEEGKKRTKEVPAPLMPGTKGRLTRSLPIPLTRVTAGEHQLILRFRDEVTGHVQELREPFTVVIPSRPNAGLYEDAVRTYVEGDARRAITRLLQWPPELVRSLARDLVEREGESWKRASLMLHTEAALHLWRQRRGDDAVAHLDIGRGILSRWSQPELHRDWLLLLGYSRQADGFSGEALPFYTECATLFPEAAEAWLGTGTVYEYTAYPNGFGMLPLRKAPADPAREAVRSYEEALRIDPGHAEARLRLGRVLLQLDRAADAARELALAVEASHDPTVTSLAHLLAGSLDEERGDVAEADRHYRAALVADHLCQPAALALAHLLRSKGQIRLAAETLAPELAMSDETRPNPWLEYHLGLGRRFPSAHRALIGDRRAQAESDQ